MVYIILIIIGTLGVAATLWLSHPKLTLQEPVAGDPWYVLHPENFESGTLSQLRILSRTIIKWILIWMIAIYRKLSEKITLKQILKKKVRGFLYEHSQEGTRNPSEFWNKVRSPMKLRATRSPRKKATLEKVETEEKV